jgi:hypothetical protein
LLEFRTGVQKGFDPDDPHYLSLMVMVDNADGESRRGET